MKLAAMPSGLEGEGFGINPKGLTPSWRFESFPYSKSIHWHPEFLH